MCRHDTGTFFSCAKYYICKYTEFKLLQQFGVRCVGGDGGIILAPLLFVRNSSAQAIDLRPHTAFIQRYASLDIADHFTPMMQSGGTSTVRFGAVFRNQKSFGAVRCASSR